MRLMLPAALLAALPAALLAPTPAAAQDRGSSAHQQQMKGEAAIPRCTRKLGTVAIVEPDSQWWRELNLGSPEAILKWDPLESTCRHASLSIL